MALYYFVLKNRWTVIPDVEGNEFPDDASARRHAVEVAHQLMRNRERDTRLWHLEVRDENLRLQSRIFFWSVDPTFEKLPLALRESVDLVVRANAGLNDAMLQVQSTMTDMQATLSRVTRLLAPPLS